jgi:hypothetical protein
MDGVRGACKKPVLGYALSGCEDGEDPDDIGEVGAENPLVCQAFLPHLAVLRSEARWLCFDALVAARANAAQRTADDLHALLALSRYSDEHDLYLEQLVRVSIVAWVCDTINEALTEMPDLLSESLLADIDKDLRDTSGSDQYVIRIDTERTMVMDIAQRMFTDDGHRSGHICAKGLHNIQEAFGGPALRGSSLDIVLTALYVENYGSRRLFVDTYDRLVAQYATIAATPLWLRPVRLGPDECDRIEHDPFAARVEKLAVVLCPALGKAASAAEQITLQRDAAFIVIALARYRLGHGQYPETLDQLTPSYLEAVPFDRFDGKQFRYKLADGRPRLYSIGGDGDDDGGRPMRARQGGLVRTDMSRVNPFEGDWVFFPVPHDAPPENTSDKGSGQ